MRRLLLLLLCCASPAAAQDLATLRPFATVEDAVVRLEDLFEGLGARGALALGPAPPPGQRLVVEAAQLRAIARRNNVAWQPGGGADRVVLDRPGRALTQEEVLDALRQVLGAQGVEAESALVLNGFTAPLLPPSALPQILVEQASYEAASGRFAASLAVAAEGMATQRVRLAGRVVATHPVLVAVRRMGVGEVVRPQDVRLVRLPAGQARIGAADRAEQAVGQALRRPAAAGQPVLLASLAPPLSVERGATVTLHYEARGLSITAQGRAMEGAARGAVVPVMNLGSRIVVEGIAIGPGQVRVEAPR
jgi:flagella basal body P-ring formation protein FlgA